jgi:hypothetical protein
VKCSNDVIFQVSEKTQELNIGKMEAIFEVYTDLLVESAGGLVDQALLWILRQDIKEFCVRMCLLIALNYCMHTFSKVYNYRIVGNFREH